MYYKREVRRISEELNKLSEEGKDYVDELSKKTYREQLQEKLDDLYNKLTELGYNFE